MQYDKMKSRLGSTISRRNELQRQLVAVCGQEQSVLLGRIAWLNRQITALRRNMNASCGYDSRGIAELEIETVVSGVYTLHSDGVGLPAACRGQFRAEVQFDGARTDYTLYSLATEVASVQSSLGLASAALALVNSATGRVDPTSGSVFIHLPLRFQYTVDHPMGPYEEESLIEFPLSTACGSPLNEAGWFTLTGRSAFLSGTLRNYTASLTVTGQFSGH